MKVHSPANTFLGSADRDYRADNLLPIKILPRGVANEYVTVDSQVLSRFGISSGEGAIGASFNFDFLNEDQIS